MKNFDFATEDLVYKQCVAIEPELREIIIRTLNSCGNRYLDDALQDTYIKAIKLFLNANIMVADFRKQLLDLCQEICFEYYWAEKKNYAKPRKGGLGWGDNQDGIEFYNFLWEISADETPNVEDRMITKEQIESIKEYKKQWLTYYHAKEFVGLLQLRNKKEWDNYCEGGKMLKNIPIQPDVIYKQFKTWDEWLSVSKYSFEDCVNWVRNNVKATSKEEWKSIIKTLPVEVPESPEDVYKNEWLGWDYFLGYSRERELYLPYAEAQKWIEKHLLLFNPKKEDWDEYILGEKPEWPSLPTNIPKNPEILYDKNGWTSWFRWFGKQNYQKRVWPITYQECTRWVKQNLAVVSTKEQWDRFIAGEYPIYKPDYIPPSPHVIFRGIGWHGWDAFLSNNRKGQFYNEIFAQNHVKVFYDGEKIWVKPMSLFRDTITGRVVTVFCKAGEGSEITFKASDILSMNSLGKDNSQKRLRNKYKLAV